jgi:hypothetical protein
LDTSHEFSEIPIDLQKTLLGPFEFKATGRRFVVPVTGGQEPRGDHLSTVLMIFFQDSDADIKSMISEVKNQCRSAQRCRIIFELM